MVGAGVLCCARFRLAALPVALTAWVVDACVVAVVVVILASLAAADEDGAEEVAGAAAEDEEAATGAGAPPDREKVMASSPVCKSPSRAVKAS